LILYAIPTPLGGAAEDALPASTLNVVRSLRDFAVENAKSARAFLSQVGMPVPMRELRLRDIQESPEALLQPLRDGRSLGLLSEAGCPAIADPGASLVEAAHGAGFRVVPLIGPASIVLALMASGLEGQRFAFCGYVPRDARDRAQRIRELEARSRREDETQIFIETPYRSDALLGALLETCSARTKLCVAADLTLPSETIATRPVARWRAAQTAIGRRPAVFLLLADHSA
jgi:16S rRNA (cytidine1402-2'-O)-methyltransferase